MASSDYKKFNREIKGYVELQSKVKALSGVDILTDTGAYKSTYDILLEISRVGMPPYIEIYK